MTKITIATLKSFLKKNEGKIFIKVNSSFDGMVDCVMPVESDFAPAEKTDRSPDNTLGYSRIWIVRGSNDYLQEFENENFKGYLVSNCCGSFVVAIAK